MSDDLGAVLTALAREAIGGRLGVPLDSLRSLGDRDVDGRASAARRGDLDAPGACFVTLTLEGRLRGCIGSLQAYRPLADDVRANACAAAFDDPRFPPLSAEELADTHIEVSVLSTPEPFPVVDEADAVSRLRPHVDGVILTEGRHRGTFLPQVWEQLPEPGDFLRALKRKAGLPMEHWSPEIGLQRYTVTAYEEPPR